MMYSKPPASLTFDEITDLIVALPIAIVFTLFVEAFYLVIDFEHSRKKRKTRSQQ